MAFPTSPSDNQVYKIGNRVWVYDSTLGVWDKVAANDTNISDQTGVLGRGVTGGSGLDAQAGNQVLISTQTANGNPGVAFSSSLITDTYDDYILDINGVVPVTNGAHPFIQMSADNGSTFPSIATGRNYEEMGGTGTGHEYNNEAYIVIGWTLSNTATEGASARVLFHDLRNASKWKHGSFFTSARHSSNRYAWHGGFECKTTSAINWLNFKYHVGNVSSGRFNLYGIKK